MWIVAGYDGQLRFQDKFNLSPKIHYEFLGSAPEYKSDCKKQIKLGIKDAFVCTHAENVVYNILKDKTGKTTVFERYNFNKKKISEVMFRFSLNVVDNNFSPVLKIHEESSTLYLNAGRVDLPLNSSQWRQPKSTLWNNQEAIKKVIEYLYTLVPKGVLIENLYLSKGIILSPYAVETHSLYIRNLSDSLVDCCILRSDLKGFVKNRDFILL